jgi:hypothetical protein
LQINDKYAGNPAAAGNTQVARTSALSSSALYTSVGKLSPIRAKPARRARGAKVITTTETVPFDDLALTNPLARARPRPPTAAATATEVMNRIYRRQRHTTISAENGFCSGAID